MRKKVILCEGMHDGVFIEKILNGLGMPNNIFKIFSQENLSIKLKKNAETNELRRFLEDNSYNPYKLLVKLEGGNNSAIKIFCAELVNFFKKDVDLILILDNDRLDVSQRITSLKRNLDRRYLMTTPLDLSYDKINKTNDLNYLLVTISLRESKRELGKFKLVLFNESLECSCKIDKNKHSKEKKIELIEKFLKKEKIVDFFNPIVLG